mgnify:CR=1 FL=1
MKRVLFTILSLASICSIAHAQTCQNNLVKYGDFTVVGNINKKVVGKSFTTDLTYSALDDPTSLSTSIGVCCIADKYSPSYWNGRWHLGTGEGGDVVNTLKTYNPFLLIDMAPRSQVVLWEQEVEVVENVAYNLSFKVTNLEKSPYSAQDPQMEVRVVDANGFTTLVAKNHPDMISGLDQTAPNTSVDWRIDWTEIAVQGNFFTPYLNAQNEKVIKLQFIGIDAQTTGCDMGLDDICLHAPEASSYLAANDLCAIETFTADFSSNPNLNTVTKWLIDDIQVSGTGSSISVPSTTRYLAAGEHTVTVYYTESGSSVVKNAYTTFTVYDPNRYGANLSYEWDLTQSLPQINLDASHQGVSVAFKRYPDDTKATSSTIGLTGTEYLATIDCSIASGINSMTYVCKEVDYGCSSNPIREDCEYICPITGCGIQINSSAVAINGNNKYEVTLDIDYTGAGTITDVYWTFEDGTAGVEDDDEITHEFAATGTYEVCAVIETSTNCEYSACITLDICATYDANELSDETVCLGNTPTSLDADPDNDDPPGTEYTWLLNAVNLGTGKTVSFSANDFTRPGDYEIELRKKINCLSSSFDANITVEVPDAIDFEYYVDESNGFLVGLEASRAPSNETFEWYISSGGGSAVRIHNPPASGTVDAPGDYDATALSAGDVTVTLKIINDTSGCEYEINKTFCIAATPQDCCNCEGS